jgi:hypothetical protein
VKTPPSKSGSLKPYADVITGEARSQVGVLTVHQVNEKVYFEIPTALLDRDMLWSTEIAQVPAGFGYGGTAAGNRVVRWTRRENKIYLRNVSYQIRAEGSGAIATAVDAASLQPIIMSFDVETEGKERASVIDVTRLLTSDVPEFSPKGPLGAGGPFSHTGTIAVGGLDPSRTYLDKIRAFPNNIEVRTLMTYSLPGPGPGSVNSVSALIHYSLVLLPNPPMAPRLADSRVGYFTVGFQDYGRPENQVVNREYIARYRLEKREPQAALSDPVRPIVYYISQEVPEEWRPYLKQGVEDWNAAFEQAGFKNAIVCKEAPTLKEDPDWDPEDARYSVIRWAPMAVENAKGPHLSDPRTGEILSAHIIVWHDVLKLAQTWYFVQCGDLDPQAQKLPLPSTLMGELLRYVVCHEVGHTLGLRHNHKASSSYTCAQLRDPQFTQEYGDEASIMDYGRFNYVAQPGDNARLIPKIGPYDRFAIEWGYKPLPDAKTPDDEKPALDAIAARQVSDPMLRFGGENATSAVDPTVQTEDLGSDPIEATTYGLRNLSKVALLIPTATTRPGDDYTQMREIYNSLLGQRAKELGHVAKLIGGVVETDFHVGHGGDVFQPEPKARQAQAVRFLLDNAFITPKDLLLPDILNRIQPTGVVDQVVNLQRSLLASLLDEGRIKRLEDQQAMQSGQSYTVLQLVTDLQSGIWSELGQPHPVIDVYRRDLQRSYIELLRPQLIGDAVSTTDLRPDALGALIDLAHTIDRALPKTTDRETWLHLRDCRSRIDRILHPKS